ncbi:hypothetical protein HYV49_04845 [Candidatus Pacearchaeota archaeon]|nr:hypothetical protein [Candidatus Pacearchaeota archaeon]
MQKRGAIELSIGTIVVIVLAMSMLILGIVLVRSILCGAINLTGDVNTNVKKELQNLFQSTGGEVVCIGSGGSEVSFVPGRRAQIHCSINAPDTAEYTIKMIDIQASKSGTKVEDWVQTSEWKGRVAPGDSIPKTAIRLDVPTTAPEENIIVSVEIERNGELISTQDLDFRIQREGIIKGAVC